MSQNMLQASSTYIAGDGEPCRAPSSATDRLDRAIENATRYILMEQQEEGYWWSELESNVTITAEYLMLFHLLGCVEPTRQRKMVQYLYSQQAENGAWELYYGDGGELSTTIEAYFALKLAGENPESERLVKAREFILSGGGIESARVFTKIWLALFSQYDWDLVPSMPVEITLLPTWSPFNIYEFSSWARSTVVPLSITMAYKPTITVPAAQGVKELYLNGDSPPPLQSTPVHKLFYLMDRALKHYERRPIRWLRRKALAASERWVLEHQEETGDWGGIQPPMVYGVVALHQLGYALNHPAMVRGLNALKRFCVEDNRGLSLQACVSPVWDTALNVLALLESGTKLGHPALTKAAHWLHQRQIFCEGDWQVKNSCPPGGWAFEFVNSYYPDVDDSAVVLMALNRLPIENAEEQQKRKQRGMDWCLSMQSTCGGWGAFDRDNTKVILNRIPFADTDAMVDYPTADLTGRVLEVMGAYGMDRHDPRARQGIRFIKQLQERDGAWWGRWGVNYIYGTWSVLKGLIGIGEDPREPYVRAAVRWLLRCQNSDGGWGETCESYKNPALRGCGSSTASQTAWALMGLIAAGDAEIDAVRRGIDYLINSQQPDGSWEELNFTGTGFPGHFYIRYHNYRNCFPLMALGQYRRAVRSG